jgi:stage V sporulation protein R
MSAEHVFPGGYTTGDLEKWNERIEKTARDFGLDFFPIEYEACDQDQMLGFITYSGMPAHYPHWSYGKSFERQKTLYDKGIIGLPYEMVINSNPCLAYLMRDNSLTLQVLTMAHVCAHDDFFKNNVYFSGTRPELTVENGKSRADRIRRYVGDSSIGPAGVERILDAAHALQFNMNVNRLLGKPVRNLPSANPEPVPDDPDARYLNLFKVPESKTPSKPVRVPEAPDADLLLFIRDHHSGLKDWEKDLLTIVHEEACYFLPQIETKIMNEGWASFWHKRILDALEMPSSMHLEFLVHHNQVVRPHVGGLNPYHLGYTIFKTIFEGFGGDSRDGMRKIFAVRSEDRDSSFLRRFLTEDLMRELDMFVHGKTGDRREITEITDPQGWKRVKEELLLNVGARRMPSIKVVEADMSGDRTLRLEHDFDGRELDLNYAEKTLGYIYKLWGGQVILETTVREKTISLIFSDGAMSIKN